MHRSGIVWLMPLPPVLEIRPPSGPVQAEVVIPGSKSITNRALVLAALARGRCELRGALWSEDTEIMVRALSDLGFAVEVEPDAREAANRTIRVDGRGGEIPRAGTPDRPLPVEVGLAGTAARFLTAMLCLGRGTYRVSGTPRMHERPQAELFAALRALGYRIDDTAGKLPAVIHGTGPRAGHADVSAGESSQFASALLLSAAAGGWRIDVRGQSGDELPYVEMTRRLLEAFPAAGGVFEVELDASSGSYFAGARWLLEQVPATRGSRLDVLDWPRSGWQIDAELPRHLPLPAELSRERDLADAIMTAIVLAPFAARPTRFTELGRLRVQECERVAALRTELGRCGAEVEETGDTLLVRPGPLRGAEIDTHGDHRVAMCFGMLGLAVPGMRLRGPACVAKTFPNFFAKLAALGAGVLDARSGAALTGSELVA